MSFEEWYDQHFGSADPNVVQAGNIDLGDRPAVYNEDGTVSTEKSFSIQDDPYGREVLLPQVVGGQMLSQEDAIKHYWQTGEHLGIYKDIPSADAYAKSIHERIPRLDTPDTFPVGNVMQSIRDLPGWAAYRMYRGATRNDLPGEGMSAREQEAAIPPVPTPQDWSFSRAVQHFSDQIPDLYNQLKQSVLPPGFSVRRGAESAIAPAKWLFNEIRQGVLPDEAIQEIKRDPFSANSLGAYLNAAISLSRGEGGEKIPFDARPGAIPEHVWNTFKPGDPLDPKIKVDNAGNLYEYMGSHKTVDPETGKEITHIIAKPVDESATTDGLKKSILEQQTPKEGTWLDNPFQKFLKEQYPEGTSGPFPDPETLPPGELGGKKPPPEVSEQLDKMWEEWSKKHGGQKPNFSEPPPSIGDDFPEMPPGVTPKNYWGNLNDPKYWDRKDSGPLTGQQWADIYATPDVDFTVGPKTPAKPGTPEYLDETLKIFGDFFDKHGMEHGTPGAIADWEEGLKAGDITQEQFDAAKDAILRGQNPPLPPPPSQPNPVPDWYQPPDEGTVQDFQNIEDWFKKNNFLKNRFNWEPPPQ